jgi:distribution and morphology protein 10
MHDFAAHVLRQFYAQTDWSPLNSYLYLNHSSQAVLDFAIPNGLSLSTSASPSPPFFTTYRLRALPTLTGALGYIFASIEDEEGNAQPLRLGGSSRDIRLKSMVERFRVLDTPRRPPGKREMWLGGRRVDRRDYLLYGCMHISTARVDALVATRLAPTWQLLATAISMPPKNAFGLGSSHNTYSAGMTSDKLADAGTTAPTQQQPISTPGPPPGSTNLHINLQQDTGRWFTEYSYSVDDGLLGFRVLHNLGHVDIPATDDGTKQGEASPASTASLPRLEEDNGPEGIAGGGLQGRFSAGAEVFFSPLEKSAGLSTGVRFTTLPEAAVDPLLKPDNPTPPPLQPPTTITATLNPMMGHLSTSYTAQMTRDIVACSRFDFNVYSYESELTLGAEYWLRSSVLAAMLPKAASVDEEEELTYATPLSERRLDARSQEGLSLREMQLSNKLVSSAEGLRKQSSERRWSLKGAKNDALVYEKKEEEEEQQQQQQQQTEITTNTADQTTAPPSSIFGVLKARVSTSGIVALMWEGRLRNCLVSLGVRGDLSSFDGVSGLGTQSPIRGVGIDVMYFSQNGE